MPGGSCAGSREIDSQRPAQLASLLSSPLLAAPAAFLLSSRPARPPPLRSLPELFLSSPLRRFCAQTILSSEALQSRGPRVGGGQKRMGCVCGGVPPQFAGARRRALPRPPRAPPAHTLSRALSDTRAHSHSETHGCSRAAAAAAAAAAEVEGLPPVSIVSYQTGI